MDMEPVDKKGDCTLLVGKTNCITTMETSLSFSYNVKYTFYDATIPFIGMHLMEIKTI